MKIRVTLDMSFPGIDIDNEDKVDYAYKEKEEVEADVKRIIEEDLMPDELSISSEVI